MNSELRYERPDLLMISRPIPLAEVDNLPSHEHCVPKRNIDHMPIADGPFWQMRACLDGDAPLPFGLMSDPPPI